MIDLLFSTHNRREFTEASLDALIEHTSWQHVQHLHLLDDHSTDGTFEWLLDRIRMLDLPCRVTLHTERFGGSVATLNAAVDHCGSEILGKIDNDVIVCPGWLETMLHVLHRAPKLDALGMEPGFGAPLAAPEVARDWVSARWIGGVGLIRTRVFKHARPRQTQRFFGWTAFQRTHVTAGWVSPDLPTFLLDHLPFDPWRSLAVSYVDRGWQRAWPAYEESMRAYWSWWSESKVAA